MSPADRNADARKLLRYFYSGYERVGGRNFSITPQERVLSDLGFTTHQYRAAMNRLLDKRLLKAMTLGGGCSLTEYGVQAFENAATLNAVLPLATKDEDHSLMEKPTMVKPDPAAVFVIHGRNLDARTSVEHFLRALALRPIDFHEVAADLGAAFIGDIVREGMNRAQGIIALFTPDEAAFLRPEYGTENNSSEDLSRWQARPNVIFEAGMAYGTAPARTILVVLGAETKLFSDLHGLYLIKLSNAFDARARLRQKLIGAGCAVDQRSDSWSDPKRAGDFDACVLPEVSTSSPFRSG